MKQLVNNSHQNLILMLHNQTNNQKKMLLSPLKNKQKKNLKIFSLKTNMNGKQMAGKKKLNPMKEEEKLNI